MVVGFIVVVLVFGAVVVGSSAKRDLLDVGTFIVLALTLVALTIYAYDTNSMARVARARWAREGVLATTYEMEETGLRGQTATTVFRIRNTSQLLVRARVKCNLRVYGDAVAAHDAYDGRETWLVFPQQMSQGWFNIEEITQKKGKTIATMVAERSTANADSQLTMDLELEFRDELGARRKLPTRRHYFDFDAWRWVPILTVSEQWD
jgi:hypothetical protein